MNLGKRVKLMRELRGIDQLPLAERVPMKQATLSALETRDSVRSRFLFALAKELQVPADWLMDGNESLLTPQDRQMVRMAIGAIAQAKHKLPLATSLKRGASKR